jgi:hypothetical protein
LAQKDILRGQFGLRTQQVSREAADDRARSRTKRFARNRRRTGEDRLQFGDDTGEHEADLRRDELHFQALAGREIFNDPVPRERSSQDNDILARTLTCA